MTSLIGSGCWPVPRGDIMRFLTLANQLTILRIMMIPAFVLLIVYGYLGAALITFSVAGATDALDVVTVLPPASRTVTTGCVAHADVAVPPLGWVLKTSCVAAPVVTLNVLLVAPVNPLLAAVKV